MTGHVVTFYSYKGGVGRSFLLANAAAWLARAGFRVLCVDWDLEAPGLHHYFQERGLLAPGPRAGLVDLLSAIQRRQQRPDWAKLVREVNVPEARGELALLDAGDARLPDYGQKLAELSWKELYESPERALGQRLEELRAEWLRRYDLVFLDSRTGLTDSGGVCTAQLPDIVVLVFAPNLQGLEGTLGVVQRARAQRALLPIDRGGFLTLPVPSRFDPNAAGDGPEKWMRILAERLQPLYDEWREKDVSPARLATLLRVPYAPRWSFGEPLPVLEETGDDPTTVSYAITTIAAFLARRLQESKRLVEERAAYVGEVLERNRALLGREAEERPSFEYDLFLSFSAPERDFARQVALLLGSQHGLQVYFDEQSLEAGQRWVLTLEKALRQARGLVSLVGERPSSWQRTEVDVFRPLVKEGGDRYVLPVLLGDKPDWPELFAFQGIAGRGRSPAQVAEEIHGRLERREERSIPDAPARAAEALSWTPAQALAAYRVWVAKEHERLVPYFEGASDMLLDEVCVRIDLEPTAARGVSHEAEIDLRSKASPAGPRTLGELLLPETRGPRAPRWAVVGEPGAGKTTLARSLARASAKDGTATPIFVALARLKEASLDPVRFAVADALGVDAARGARGQVLERALRATEEAGGILLLLDGLDEVDPEAVGIDPFLASVVRYAEAHPEVALAILGRPIAFERRELPASFQRARVLPLPREQQDLLLQKLLGDAEGERVRHHLHAHAALAELARSPLLLTLLAVVARDTVLAERPLPANRSKLYETAIDLLLRRGFGIVKRGVKDTQPARRLLRMLSRRLHEQGGETWPRERLSEELTALRRASEEANFDLKQTWGTNDAFLDDVGTNAGVLGPHDGPGLPWRYLHRSLREFLVAEDLASRPRDELESHFAAWAESMQAWGLRRPEERKDEEPDPARWAEVYALLCGLVPDPREILEALKKLGAGLALRTLESIDALAPEEMLASVLALEDWEPQFLLGLVTRLGFERTRAALFLSAGLGRNVSTENLARVWVALERLGISPDRKSFFEACERPLPEGGVLTWVKIPAGRFLMGSKGNKGHPDEKPAHRCTIGAFQLATTPVTRAQFRAFDPSPDNSREIGTGASHAADLLIAVNQRGQETLPTCLTLLPSARCLKNPSRSPSWSSSTESSRAPTGAHCCSAPWTGGSG